MHFLAAFFPSLLLFHDPPSSSFTTHTSRRKLELLNLCVPNAILPISQPNATRILRGVCHTWVVPPMQSHGYYESPTRRYLYAMLSDLIYPWTNLIHTYSHNYH